MELAYLGLFSKVFNWVLDKIFEPIFKWLSSLLNTVFTWIFNEILSPILFPILEEVMWFMIDLYKTIYGTLIYTLFSGVLKLIDYMETAFDVFIGIRDVSYTPVGGATIKGSLVEVLLQQETVSTIFWALTLAGIGIALILTIFGTAKSSFDLDFENKRPVSKVLTAMMKTFIQFFMVPFFVYFMLIISTDILKVATDALTGDTKTTLGRIVFTIASLNAAKNSSMNATSNPAFDLGTSPKDTSRFPFYITGSYTDGSTGKVIEPRDYGDIALVNDYFNFGDFDYLVGFLAAIFLLFVMAICMITFVQRIFEIILLYIVSPYFVSTMPLDDGERFGRWRDMFIGKCFTGFGSAIGMRLYLVVCQMIMGNQIRFTEATLGSSIEIDYFMKLFFLLGGAWAVFKSGPMVTQILSSAAGQQETATQSVAGGALYGHTIGKAMKAGKGAVMSAFRGKDGALERDRKTKNADPKQKFEGAKNDRMTKASQNWKKGVKPTGPRAGTVTIGAKRSMKPGVGAGTSWKDGAAPTSNRAGKITIGANRNMKPVAGKPASMAWKSGVAPTGERPKSFAIGANRSGTVAPQIRPRRMAMSRDQEHLAAAKAATEAAGMKFGATSKTSADTAFKEKRNIRLGSAFQSTYDEKGNHKIRVLGFCVNRDSSGNTMAFKMPVMNMKVQRTDPNQSMKLARMHIPGIAKIDSNVRGGKLQYSDISVLHGLGSYQKNAAGSHVSVAGIHTHKYTDGDTGVDVGKLHIKGGSNGDTSVDIGKLHIKGGNNGDTVSLGSNISFKTTADGKNFQSVKVGSLEYTRSGITKKVPQSAVFGSTPAGTTQPKPTVEPSSSATQKSAKKSVEVNLKSTKKPGNETKTGGGET